MGRINNRYEILNEEISSSGIIILKIKDSYDNKIKSLYILEDNIWYERIKEKVFSEFEYLKSYNFENIINIYELINIKSIEESKFSAGKLGYITEYLEDYKPLKDILDDLSFRSRMKIFGQICAIANTLCIQGYKLPFIKEEDVYAKEDNGEYFIKLRDLISFEILNKVTIDIEKKDIVLINDFNLRILGEIFYKIFKKEITSNGIRSEEIKSTYLKLSTNKGAQVFQNIGDCIKYLNNVFSINIPLFNYGALNKINKNTNIIGRDYEINRILKSIDSVHNKKIKNKVIFIKGEEGSGKSTIINYLKSRLLYKYQGDINIINMGNWSKKEWISDLADIVQQYCEDMTVDNYCAYMNKYIENIDENENEKNVSNEEYIAINRILKLFGEIAEEKTTILITDDLETHNDRVRSFLNYIMSIITNYKNIIFISTTRSEKLEDNFISKLLLTYSDKEIDVYTLEYLSEYETTKLISMFLKTNKHLYEFSSNVYRDSLGNPKYIKAIIMELYENKSLYIDKHTGEWKWNNDNYKIEIPIDLQEALNKKLKSLNAKEISLLEDISIFTYPLMKDFFIKNYLKGREDEFIKLKELRILVEKISDKGFSVDYHNNLFKKVVYSQLMVLEKEKKHKEAIKLLEENFDNKVEILEELISQYEALNMYDKCSELCNNYAKEMSNHSKEQSMHFYKRALNYVKDDTQKCINLNYEIGKTYEYLGKSQNAYEYYLKVRELSNNSYNKEFYAALLRMSYISIERYGLIHAENILDEATELLGPANNYEGNIWSRLIRARIMFEKSELELALKESLELLDDYDNRDSETLAYILLLIGSIKCNQGNYLDGKEHIIHAMNLFKDINHLKGYIECNINLGLASLFTIGNEEKSKSYCMKAYKISQDYDIEDYNFICKLNMALLHTINLDYIKASEICSNLINNTKDDSFLFYRSIAYFILGHCYTQMEELSLANEYLILGMDIMERINCDNRYPTYIIYFIAEYYAKIGKYDESVNLLASREKSMLSYDTLVNKIILCQYYCYCIKESRSLADIKEILSKLKLPLSQLKVERYKLLLSYNIIMHLNDIGLSNVGRKMFQGCVNNSNYTYINLINIYLKLIYKIDNKDELLNSAIREAKKVKNKTFVSKVYYLLGNIKSNSGELIKALNYYYESMMLVAINALKIEENNRISYINSTDFRVAYNKFFDLFLREFNINTKKQKIYDINNNCDLIELIENINIDNLMKNKYIFKLLEKNYSFMELENIESVYDIFNIFTNNILKNIDLLLKFILKQTLAEKVILFIANDKNQYEIVHSININNEEEVKESLLNISCDKNGMIIREDNITNINNNLYKLLPEGIRSAMIFDIFKNSNDSTNEKIAGRLIIMSEGLFNNISKESKENILKMNPFINFILDQYKLKLISTLDKLTGVYNRKYLEDIYPKFITESKEEGKVFSAVIFDIDNFKGVNDKFGHQVGDEVLIKVSKIVKDSIEEEDILARYGGEEFVILMQNKNSQEAFEKANRIRLKVQNAKALGDKRELTISMGVAEFPKDSNNSRGLIKKADQALYVAKESGRNKCIIWEDNFSKKNNANDKLAGIITGNTIKDYRKVSLMMDVVSLIGRDISFEDKLEKLLSIIIEIAEANEGTLFVIENNSIKFNYTKKQFVEGWINETDFNYDILNEVIHKKDGIFLVDWEKRFISYENQELPDWKSLCVVPIVNSGHVKACLYLSVSINKKEFSFEDYNYIRAICEIATAIF